MRPLQGLVVLAALSTAPAGAAELTVRLDPAAPAVTEVRLVPRSGAGETIRRSVPASTTEAHFSSLAPGLWSVQVLTAGRWAPDQVLALREGSPAEVVVPLFETAQLEGSFAAPAGVAADAPLSLRLTGVEVGRRGSSFLVDCAIRDDRFSCLVPAGRWDLRLRLPLHASHHRWGVHLPPHRARDLGKITFRPGGSVVGWAPTCAEMQPGKSCRASLLPWLGDEDSAQEKAFAEALRIDSKVDERGFFELTGVAGGTYTLLVEAPDEAAFGRLFPVRIHDGMETEIARPVALEPLLELEISVEPALDLGGGTWAFELQELGVSGHPRGTVAEGNLREGHWSRKGIPPGRYRLLLRAKDGSRWLAEDLQVSSASRIFHFRLPLVTIEGTIALGDAPLAARLWFGGEHGARRIGTISDDEGRFQVTVPEAGPWRIAVLSMDRTIHRTLEADVPEPAGEAAVELDLELPDTRISGSVVDASGRAARSAIVTLLDPVRAERPVVLRADAEGRFSSRGLGPGRIQVFARQGDALSEQVEVVLSQAVPERDVALTLRETRTVRGFVRSPTGPVAGAEVLGYSHDTLAGSLQVTGADGGFTLRTGADTHLVNLVVLPPGRTFTALRLGARDEPVVVPVEDRGGTLVFPGGFAALDALDRKPGGRLLLYAQGVAVDLDTLRQWGSTQGALGGIVDRDGGTALPQMGPGSYALCRVPAGVLPDPTTVGANRCIHEFLEPGGTRVLDVRHLD
ncbi:MAG TPA: carboxypeptidase-like regulatory domain-containing protein [Thermoanaerobaculia bacterium]|nr:carboxypeptidase-like regulatory domain-containing protein [Thermoanaerobaculia bacterium]